MSTTKNMGDQSNDIQTVRIGIAGKWDIREFAELMSQLQFLSNIALIGNFKAHDDRLLETIGAELGKWGLQREKRRSKEQSWVSISRYFLEEKVFRHRRDRVEFDEGEFERHQARLFRLQFDRFMNRVLNASPLVMSRITFASPEIVDVAGIGKIVEQIRLFVKDVYDRSVQKEDQEIKAKSAAQDVLAKKIANAEALLKLGRSAGLSEDTSMVLVFEVLDADRFFSEKIATKQIISIENR